MRQRKTSLLLPLLLLTQDAHVTAL